MLGMNKTTGKPLTGREHIIQSIREILSTPLGSRVMLRDYGSRLPDLVDRPMNELLVLELNAATAEALERWEPRFKLLNVWLEASTAAGHITIGVEGVVKEEGAVVRIEGITV